MISCGGSGLSGNLDNMDSQSLFDEGNCSAGEIMASPKPSCNIGWASVGKGRQLLFANSLFFHNRIYASRNAVRYGIGSPVESRDAVVRLLNDGAENLDVFIWFHNSKVALSIPVMTFCSILIFPLASS